MIVRPVIAESALSFNLEDVGCNLCRSKSYRLLRKAKSRLSDHLFSIVKCNGCGLVFINPRISFSDIHNRYLNITNILEYYGSLWSKKVDRGIFLLNYGLSKSHLKERGSLLDIGAGTGSMLEAGRSIGFNELYGIELNKVAAQHAMSLNPSFHFESVDICDPIVRDIFPKKFDAIVCSHTFEHLHNPTVALDNIRYLLNDNGVLILEVPEMQFAISRIESYSEDALTETFKPHAHLYHFTPQTMFDLLKSVKFDSVDVSRQFTNHRFLNYIGNLIHKYVPFMYSPLPNLVAIANKA